MILMTLLYMTVPIMLCVLSLMTIRNRKKEALVGSLASLVILFTATALMVYFWLPSRNILKRNLDSKTWLIICGEILLIVIEIYLAYLIIMDGE